MFFEKYPYSNFHELNLDWLIAKMKELNIAFDEFKVINQITFSGAWDITTQYPAWTIVSDNNIGYVSIQPVPAGVLLTNSDYWREVIDYTAQIAGLQSRIVAIEDDIDNNIKPDITALQGDVTNLDTRVSRLEGLNTRAVFVTDSYGTHSVTNWAQRTASKLGLGGSDWYVFAEGSSGFDHAGLSGHTFETLLSSNIGNVVDPDTITDVIVGGGTNDFYYYQSSASLRTAIISFITYAKTQFPNCKITIAFMGYDAKMLRTERQNYRATIEDYGTTAIENHAKFINAYQYMHYYSYRDDAQHPNEYGNAAISNCVYAALTGSDPNFPISTSILGQYTEAPLTMPADVQNSSGNKKLTLCIQGDNAVLRIWDQSVLRPVTATTENTVLDMGTFDYGIIPIIDSDDFRLEASIEFTVSGNSVNSPVTFWLQESSGVGHLYCLIHNPIGTATGYRLSNYYMSVPLIMC